MLQVIDALRGMVCQRICAGSQFSLVLTAGGKVSFTVQAYSVTCTLRILPYS